MGMFGEIAREGMGDSLIQYLEKKARKCQRDKKSLKLIVEFAEQVLQGVDLPPQEMVERVAKLRRML